MQDVIWSDRPTLRKPVMVCAFNGWNDAGEAASAAVSFIHSSFDADEVASIDPEEFFDFTAVRPTVRLTDGVTREIDWPFGRDRKSTRLNSSHQIISYAVFCLKKKKKKKTQ